MTREEAIKQAQELIEQAYQRGFKVGQESNEAQYNKAWNEQAKDYIGIGRNEAWEVVKKIYLPVKDGGLPTDEVMKIFGVEYLTFILKEFSASEAMEKIREYEEKKHEEDEEIKVGDEVILNANSSCGPNTRAVVLMNDGSDRYPYDVMVADSDTEWVERDAIARKTNRHFPEIAEVLKKLGGNEE